MKLERDLIFGDSPITREELSHRITQLGIEISMRERARNYFLKVYSLAPVKGHLVDTVGLSKRETLAAKVEAMNFPLLGEWTFIVSAALLPSPDNDLFVTYLTAWRRGVPYGYACCVGNPNPGGIRSIERGDDCSDMIPGCVCDLQWLYLTNHESVMQMTRDYYTKLKDYICEKEKLDLTLLG